MTRRLILLVADADTGEVMEGGGASELVIVPKEPSEEILIGMIEATALANGSALEMHRRYNGMLSVSRVDLTKAEVKLKRYELADDAETQSWNACLDAITAQMKGK